MHDRFGGDRRVIEVVRLAAVVLLNSNSVDSDVFERFIGTPLYSMAEELIEHTGATVKKFTSASMKLGACIRALDGGNKDHIFGQYRALALYNYDNMFPHTKEFHKRILIGTAMTARVGSSSQIDMLMCALKVFDMEKIENSVFRITIAEQDSLRKYAKSVISTSLDQAT